MTVEELNREIMDCKRISRKMREARVAAGLLQSQVAEAMKTSRPNIARIERGTYPVKLDTLERYCSAVGVSVLYVLGVDARCDGGSEEQISVPLRRALLGVRGGGNPVDDSGGQEDGRR